MESKQPFLEFQCLSFNQIKSPQTLQMKVWKKRNLSTVNAFGYRSPNICFRNEDYVKNADEAFFVRKSSLDLIARATQN